MFEKRGLIALAALMVAMWTSAQSFDLEQFDQIFRPRLRLEARWTPGVALLDHKGKYEERTAVGGLTVPVFRRWSAGVDFDAKGESLRERLKNAIRIRASQVMGTVRFGIRQLDLEEGTRALHSASIGALGISLTKKYRILFWSANANVSEEDHTLDRAVIRISGVIGRMHVKGLRKQFYYGLAAVASDGINVPLPFVGGTVPIGERWGFQYLLPAQVSISFKPGTTTRLLAGVGVDGYRSGFAMGEERVNINYTALRTFFAVRHRVSQHVQFRADVAGLASHSLRLPDDDGDLLRSGIEPGLQVTAGVNLFFGQSTMERLLDDVLK